MNIDTMAKIELGSPIRANLEITEACPLACKHCYTYWGFAATGKKVFPQDESYKLEHFSRIIDILSNRGVRTLTLTGGEPFEKRDILYPLIKFAKDRGMIVFVNTSAILVEQKDVEIIKSLNADGFLVSLMSCDKETNNRLAQADSYDKTINGIKNLVEAGQNVNINMVCSKENYKDVRRTALLVEKLGAWSFSAAPMMAALSYPDYLAMRLSGSELNSVIHDLLWVKEHTKLLTTTLEALPYCAFSENELEELRPILSHSYCGAGLSDCAISVSGDIRPCIMSGESVGNILKDDWDDIWRKLSKWRSGDILPSECLKCTAVDECGGGCRVSAKTVNGSFSANDPYMVGRLSRKLAPAVSDTHAMPGKSVFSKDTRLCISRKAVDRHEPFGGTVFIGNRAVFLKEGPYELYCRMKEMRAFSPAQIEADYGVNLIDFLNFIQLLLDEGIVDIMETYK